MAERVEISEEQYERAYRTVWNLDLMGGPIPQEAKRVRVELNKILNERWRADRNQVTDGSVYFDIFPCDDIPLRRRYDLAKTIARLLNENDVRS